VIYITLRGKPSLRLPDHRAVGSERVFRSSRPVYDNPVYQAQPSRLLVPDDYRRESGESRFASHFYESLKIGARLLFLDDLSVD
jgi:hypothetical protein